MSLTSWALPQLARILPLDEDSLKQIITYTDTLSKEDAVEHLKALLGDNPQALEFISSFNQRRPKPPSQASTIQPSESTTSRNAAPIRGSHNGSRGKKKATLHTPAPRRLDDGGDLSGAYLKKKEEDDYMQSHKKPSKQPPLANTLALGSTPNAIQSPVPSKHNTRLPPSAAGSLTSDLPTSPAARQSSHASPSTTKTTINVSGGTSMRGQSATLNDLDSAIRQLESQTNPSLTGEQDKDSKRRRCNCMAQRHDLLTAAPNCLACGKIICAKEGLGPCTFCNAPLLSGAEIQDMVQLLREERGKERMQANNTVHKRAQVSKAPRPFATPSLSTPPSSTPASSDSEDADSAKLVAAKQHRDRLLKFQAQNAQRTRVHDEAADYDTPDAGTNMWATPQERALQLKRQQKVLRDQEWNAKPEYEKRKTVVSLDVVGGKAVKRYQKVEQSQESRSESENDYDGGITIDQAVQVGEGSFAKNPLLGDLIRPVWRGKGKEADTSPREKTSAWRRVQDDNDDNEQWILDGGAYGDMNDGRVLGAEEHAQG